MTSGLALNSGSSLVATSLFPSQIKNDAGTWVKLSNSALKYFDCSASVAYTLCYSTEKKEEFLVEKEVCVCVCFI